VDLFPGKENMSRLGNLYNRIYSLVCGKHPNVRPWHFQWLPGKDLYAALKRVLPQLSGKVLDVGCGEKPYKIWLKHVSEHVGLDVNPESQADVRIRPGERWPFEDASFDAVLCTEVLQYIANLKNTLSEIDRVLKPGGQLVVTVPFVYNMHGVVHDFWRFSVHGVRELFADRYAIAEVKALGGIGSTVGTLLLNWAEVQMNRHKTTRWLKGMLLPVWLVFCGWVNVMGWLMDLADGTKAFYVNVLLVANKRCA
jgi:SAM-dependent methyltransferase